MPLTDPDYNAFSLALVQRLSQRAKGLDEGSKRIVNLRPSDHILTGFLTPVRAPSVIGPSSSLLTDLEDTSDEMLTDDLPKDSSFEQTAIGIEWIAPRAAFVEGENLEVQAEFYVYIRRLPTLGEQKAYAVWRDCQPSSQGTHAEPSEIAATGVARVSNLIPAWTREHMSNLRVSLSLAQLLHDRKISRDLGSQIRRAARLIELDGVYPGRQPVIVEQASLDSPGAFQASLTHLPTASLPLDWRASIDIRLASVPTQPGTVRAALRLINYTDPPGSRSLDYADPNLYGISLRVTLPKDAHQPTIFQELPSSFRYNREMAGVGINAQVEKQNAGNHISLQIDSTPHTTVPRLEPREILDAVPEFSALASTPVPILRRIRQEMVRYDTEAWDRRISTLDDLERKEAIDARNRFRDEIERFGRGIDLLSDDAYQIVHRAFTLMNEAMGIAAAPHKTWRLFQIVFIVSQLQSLAAREYPQLARDDDSSIDILWFAAGGGKTEAFLALIVWQAFFDRLRGKKIGVAALVRFPLRLLTFQQLQRLARALAAAELIRQREQLGGARFSMGYYVGAAVTPNTISDELHARYVSQGVDERLQRVFECPFCSAQVSLTYEAELRLVGHKCTNDRCPGGTTRLPIYVVDEDVYRFLPTVIVSTVDKLAQLGQNQRFANLFGRFDLVCQGHGVSFIGVNKRLCRAAAEFALGTRPDHCGDHLVSYGPFYDSAPALLVQDELHLLCEELGTFDSHYETSVIELMRSFGHPPWKIIAATATIENYEQQAWQLYLRKSRQFPGPGPEAYDSFYYCQTERIGRIFLGVLGVGRKHTPAVTRTLSLFYLELQAARELAEADPAAAASLYGTNPLSREDFRRLIFLYELPLTYVLTRKGSDQVAEAIESRVKRELQDLAPSHGELLIDTFNGGVDISEMIEAMEQIRTANPLGDPTQRVRGLVTTNIIGHGVDVDRFNVILFAGFTRLVAEYIQASARVGRTYPGISIFVATPQSERDRTIFDRFSKFHEYLDRLVDPTAVNRWPEPALSRTVPGVLCGYLMGVAAQQLRRSIISVENVQDSYGSAGAESLNEDAIVTWMTRAYGTDLAPSEAYRDRLVTRIRNAFSSIVNLPRRQGGRPRLLNMHLGAMRSLRDVDDPAFIVAPDPTDQSILKRFING